MILDLDQAQILHLLPIISDIFLSKSSTSWVGFEQWKRLKEPTRKLLEATNLIIFDLDYFFGYQNVFDSPK